MKRISWPLTIALSVALISGCAKDNSGTAEPSGSSPASTLAPTESAPSESPSGSPVASESPSEDASESPPAAPEPSPSSGPVTMGKVTALRLADFKSGWAGGDGWIARTDDGGKTWKNQAKPGSEVRQLFALNGKEAWAGLQNRQLLHTTDGGKTWKEAGKTPEGEFFHFISSSEAYLGNERTTDGGKTWTKLPVPEAIVGEAYFRDKNTGWAVTGGKDKLSVLSTSDGGKSWKAAMTRATEAPVMGAVIRSGGKGDAWVELIGDSGMSQTSYSLFHTTDSGSHWQPVLAHAGAGSGPAPGYGTDQTKHVAANAGAAPGPLYVVDGKNAFMGGVCSPCDLPNTMGKTNDGGKTWTDLPAKYPGYGGQLIAAADALHLWWVTTDATEPSVMYASSDGGKTWKKMHAFDKPAATK